MSSRRRLSSIGRLAARLLAAALAGAPAAAQEPGDPDPWKALDRTRSQLAAGGPIAARFVQTYVPAGFSSGEEESGRLALSLPDCLRWDYEEPYPKSFLLCGGVVHTWNPEDAAGQRREIDGADEPGLDLLLLPVERLRRRYRATAAAEGEAVRIRLAPQGGGGEIREATLLLDVAGGRVLALETIDREGNRTRFTLSGYRPLSPGNTFTPPAGIDWVGG